MLVFLFQIQITASHLHTGKLVITSTFSTSVVSSAEDIEGLLPRGKNPTKQHYKDSLPGLVERLLLPWRCWCYRGCLRQE